MAGEGEKFPEVKVENGVLAAGSNTFYNETTMEEPFSTAISRRLIILGPLKSNQKKGMPAMALFSPELRAISRSRPRYQMLSRGALKDDTYEIHQSAGHIMLLYYIGIAHRAKKRGKIC